MCMVITMQYILIALVLNIFQKKFKNSQETRNTIANIYRIQAYDWIMCESFCTGFIDFMLKGKSLLEYTNLFPPNHYEEIDKGILRYFQ